MNASAEAASAAGFHTVASADGTVIAFERLGQGPPLLLIGGAMNDRRSAAAGLPLATLLATDFSAIAYDRRGRGDSGDTQPYAPQREIEDVAALIAAIGEPVVLFGHSSGAGLAALERPLLAMVGAESPERMQIVGRRIAGAAQQGQYREIDGADHAVPPARLADELRRFVASLPPARR